MLNSTSTKHRTQPSCNYRLPVFFFPLLRLQIQLYHTLTECVVCTSHFRYSINFIKLCKKIWILHGDCGLEIIFSINTLMFSITTAHHFCVTCLSEKVIHMVHTISKSPWTLLSPWKVIDFSIRSSKVLEIQALVYPLPLLG